MKKPSRRVIVVAAVATLVILLALIGALWAKGIAGAATTGKSQAIAGAKSLASLDATAAVEQFSAASSTFSGVRASLGPEWVAKVVEAVPWAGHQYSTVSALVQMGADGSAAGIRLAELLRSASTESTSSTGDTEGRFSRLISGGHAEIDSSVGELLGIADRASAMSPDGLLPPLASAVRSVKDALSQAAPLVDRARTAQPLMSFLLSGERRILVVSQNGAELRPTGGFAGSFGILEFGTQGLRLQEYRDVYVLPDPPGRVPMPLGALMSRDFSFRDANWWIDFPTSARAMLGFWNDCRQPPVDGIVAIDTVTMKELLAATGPVKVPSFKETFTSENLLDRLLYLVQVKNVGPHRKDVVVALASELEDRVLDSSPAVLMDSAKALSKAANEKHVQLYFTDPAAQAAIEGLGWSGSVAAPSGTTDLLAISSAMTMGGKINTAIRKRIAYEVLLAPDGSADTTLALNFANTGPFPLPISSVFRNWLRVYRKADTIFPGTALSGEKTLTMREFGFPAEARTFVLLRGQSRTETFLARVPRAIEPLAPFITLRSAAAAHYRLRMIRQADLRDVPTTVMVTAPPGWRITGASAHYIASGEAVGVDVERGRAILETPLRGDLEIDVRLASF